MGELNAPHDGWPDQAPQRVGLRIDAVELETIEAVWAAIDQLGPAAQGWICLSHQVVSWPEAPSGGALVSAEFALEGQASLHIRRGSQGWLAWRYSETVEGDCLVFRERFRGTVPDRPDRYLGYATYWSLQDIDGIEVYRPYAARFTGWEAQ